MLDPRGGSLRATLNGFCAACGKLGATIGSAIFKPLAKASLNGTMIVCSMICVLGIVLTYFFIEDRRGKGMEGERSGLARREEIEAEIEATKNEL